MAGVVDGTRVDAANSNAAWIAKNGDDVTVGTLGLEKVDGVSGYFVANTQRYLNNIAQTIGLVYTGNYSAETDATGRTYGSTSNAITNGDTYKAAITKLSNKFADTVLEGGHTHDGTDGNGGPIAFAKLTGAKVGQANCVTGSSSVSVTFVTPYPNNNYRPVYSFRNELSSFPIFLQGMTTAKSETGFTVTLNTPPDDTSYFMDWHCLEDVNP